MWNYWPGWAFIIISVYQCWAFKYYLGLGEYDHNKCVPSDSTCVSCESRLPDCKGLPDGDNGIKAMLWSLNYVKCDTGRTIEVQRCNSGVFDPNIRQCSSSIDPGLLTSRLFFSFVITNSCSRFQTNGKLTCTASNILLVY